MGSLVGFPAPPSREALNTECVQFEHATRATHHHWSVFGEESVGASKSQAAASLIDVQVVVASFSSCVNILGDVSILYAQTDKAHIHLHILPTPFLASTLSYGFRAQAGMEV